MFIPLKKQLLLKYLFLFSLFFACAAGICSAAFVLVTAIMICGVVMTNRAFFAIEGEGVKEEALVLDLIFRFAVCGVAVVSVGIREGLNEWYSVIIYAVYIFCLSAKLINNFSHDIKNVQTKKKKPIRDLQEAAVTFLIPAIYLLSAISSKVFAVAYYVILGLAACSYMIRIRVKRVPKKLMLVLGILAAIILILILVFTVTGVFTA